jgi:replication-associated recombination protein RarA
MEYSFKTIDDIIEIAEKYKFSRKRPRTGGSHNLRTLPVIDYNSDLERLSYCIKPLKKLNKLIGMDDLKKNIIDQILFYSQQLNTNEMMHICLNGPPGVGKTTLGKILAELYCSLGFLDTNNFTVVTSSDLIAGYVGQTAIKTKKVLKNSLGGVLFLDEAYSIGSGDSETVGFSKECADTINAFLSEHTSNFIMIIAGYSEELEKCFFSLNKGLKRRFPWTYTIKKYSSSNLKDIFLYQVKENGWDIEITDPELETLFTEYSSTFDNNGGDTLILFDKAKIVHSRRVFGKKRKLKMTLNLDDLKYGFELLKLHKTAESKEKPPPYGMYL